MRCAYDFDAISMRFVYDFDAVALILSHAYSVTFFSTFLNRISLYVVILPDLSNLSTLVFINKKFKYV